MLLPRLIAGLLCASMLTLGAGSASGQAFPTKPIRIFTSDAGGGNDIAARIIAQGMSGPLGQQVLVENRGGVLAGDTVSKAAPDGYNVLFIGDTVWVTPLLKKDAPYDALKDFAPITLATIAPIVLAVHPSLPVKSVKELVALAKARPGKLNYGSPAVGTGTHMATELFKSMAGVNIQRIGYKGGAGVLNDLMGGHIEVAFLVVTSAGVHVKSGRLRALAITSPSPLFPDMPTVASAGLPGYEASGLSGMFAPIKTPDAIVQLLSREMNRSLARPESKERFQAIGVETVGTTPEQFTTRIKSEVAKWIKVIKEANIRDD